MMKCAAMQDTCASKQTAFMRVIFTCAFAALFLVFAIPLHAQTTIDGWTADGDTTVVPSSPNAENPAPPPVTPDPTPPEPPPRTANPGGTTEIPRAPDSVETESRPAQVRLIALLTVDGQRIDQGIVWRVYRLNAPGGGDKLVGTHKEASPLLQLPPGDYMVNAAFGRAHLTRKISVKPGQNALEQFVLNAGGLRLAATVDGADKSSLIVFDIYSDERDQFGNRAPVLTGAKPGLVHRLNAGLYQIVSRYGDANAIVEADVTVEAGKLTEVAVAHSGAAVTFKLVARTGGEALPEAQWVIQTEKGEVVKESVGALPTHILAPGAYLVRAKTGGRAFNRAFLVKGGEAAEIEVVMP